MDSPLSVRLSFAEGSNGVRKVNVPNETLVTTDDRLVQIDSLVVSHHGGDKVLFHGRDTHRRRSLAFRDRDSCCKQAIERTDDIFILHVAMAAIVTTAHR